MGCGNSTNTTVRPLADVNGDEAERESKPDGRGESAVSKGTTDSGVVMEHRDILVLPGAIPSKLTPLTSESIRESEAEKNTQNANYPGFLEQDIPLHERQKSSEILEELLSEGIIPLGQSRQGASGAAYSITLDDGEGIVRKPPARLESLKVKKAQILFSREEIDEKMRLAEERRKLKQDKLKMRLRSKSARVRAPAPISNNEEDGVTFLTPVEALQSPLTADTAPAPEYHKQIPHKATERGERVTWAGSDGREFEGKVRRVEETKGGEEKGEFGDNRGQSAVDGEKDGEKEVTLVEEFEACELLTPFGELENDSSFQHSNEIEEIF